MARRQDLVRNKRRQETALCPPPASKSSKRCWRGWILSLARKMAYWAIEPSTQSSFIKGSPAFPSTANRPSISCWIYIGSPAQCQPRNPQLPCPPTSDKPVMPIWSRMTLSVITCPPDPRRASHGDAPISKDAQRRHGVKESGLRWGVSAPRLRCGVCPLRQQRA